MTYTGTDLNDWGKDKTDEELRAFVDSASRINIPTYTGAGTNRPRPERGQRKSFNSSADRLSDDRQKILPKIISAEDFVKGYVAPDFVIEDVVQRGFLYSNTGRTGDGKTAWGTTTAVVRGAGIGCQKIRILYLAGENPDDIRARFIMTCDEFGKNPVPSDARLQVDENGLRHHQGLRGNADDP